MTLTQNSLQLALTLRPFRYYEQTSSTNDVARDWLRDGAANGAVVIANEQLQGRGRKGRTWRTPPNVALAVSVVLKPSASDLGQLSMLGALAIADVAEAVGASPVGIKWPNDVQVGGLKVCGILPEAEWHGDHLLGAVLGLGVNVRANFEDTELAGKAISLETAVGHRLDRIELLVMLLEHVDYWFARLGSDELLETWKSRLNMLGQVVAVNAVQGVAEAVDAYGALLVRDADGQLQRVVAGDIALGVSQ